MGCSVGTLGGSYLSNDRVKRWIKQATKEKDWPVGELAVILRRFEEEKCMLDAESVDKDVIRKLLLKSHLLSPWRVNATSISCSF